MIAVRAFRLAALAGALAAFGVDARAQGVDALSRRADALEARLAETPLRVAQNYPYRPQADVGDDQDQAGLGLRLDKLEAQMRQITGQLEQLQFANRKLEDGMRKMQQDMEFRFQELGHGPARPQKRTELSDPVPPPVDATVGSPATPSSVAPPRAGRRGDAFDPGRDPAPPGAPRTLGSPASASTGLRTSNAADAPAVPQIPNGSIIADDNSGTDAPFDLNGGRLRNNAAPAPASPIPARPQTGGAAAVTPGGTVIASAAPETPKEEYDLAFGYFKDKQYESAEKGFSAFLQKNPRNRLASDALYYLGESFYQRGRPADAAQQFLKISTDYASSARAPEAYLRLGQSLHALGAKEQACAAFSEIGRKYPNASASIKNGADREAKRSQC